MNSPLRLLAAVCLLLLSTTPSWSEVKRGPFTQPPRSVRSRDVDQRHVRLELKFDFDKQEIRGRETLTLKPFTPVKQVTLDAADMKILHVALIQEKQPAKKLKFRTPKNKLEIDLPREYTSEQSFKLLIEYHIVHPKHGAHFVIPDKREPGRLTMVWTQSETEYAHYWYPCIDSPTDRLTSEIVATVPEKFFVLSNGQLQSNKKNNDGTRTMHWSQAKTHVPYLLSVVAGEFEAHQQKWDGIPVTSYVPTGRLPDAARSFDKTPAMMKFFSEKIDLRYPWSKYTQICVDEYAWGGMEHTTATTLNLGTLHDARAHLDVSSDGLVAHELAHQWWGDLLTCKDWGEIWLNESFATYFTTLWTEHDLGWNQATWDRHREAESYKQEDKSRYRRPIVSYRYSDPSNVFDRHSYPKGARVLHMLRHELGDDLFWKSIQLYAKRHQFQTVETSDLRTSIEMATGRGLNWFFDQWAYHGGHPDFEVSYTWNEKSKSVELIVKQTQTVDDLTPLFRCSVDIEIVTPAETKRRRVTVSKASETFHFDCSQRPLRVAFDPKDWLLKTLKFPKTKQEQLDTLAQSPHLMCRVRATEALAAFPTDKEVAAALINAMRHDALWPVRQQAAKALGKFKGDDVRKGLLQASGEGVKSFVRREAIIALGKFAHDDVRKAMRAIIQSDQSYYAVAEALKVLGKIDAKKVREDCLGLLATRSHREVILKAAANILADKGDSKDLKPLMKILDQAGPSEQRIAVMDAVARMGEGRTTITEKLAIGLTDSRPAVRRATVTALVKTKDPAAIEFLQKHRKQVQSARRLHEIDEAVTKLQADDKKTSELRKQLKQLQERLKKLEEKAK